MGVDAAWLAARLSGSDISRTPATPAPSWNRFAHWPPAQARALLVALLALLVAAAWVPITVGRGQIATPPPLDLAVGDKSAAPRAKPRPRDEDLQLYDTAIARIRNGENYYSFIVAAHRKADYPVRPAVAVRLPTLAYLEAWGGSPGEITAAIALMLGVLYAWWQRLGSEAGGPQHRNFAMALLFVASALGLNRYFFVLHELWAGMLIALAFGLHRPAEPGAPHSGRWLGAWCAAALALAIREHTLPCVLLLGAFASWRHAWREAAAWLALAALFVIGLAIHIHLIAAQTLPGDPLGPSWFAFRELGGWLSNIVLSSNLRFLHWLAGPLVMLMVLGWAGWRSAAGSFATLLYLGYGVLFMIAGRDDNFYWGAMIAPTMSIGLAFVPMAVRGLLTAALVHEPRNDVAIRAADLHLGA